MLIYSARQGLKVFHRHIIFFFPQGLLELQRQETRHLTCVPNKDSNQPVHLHSLIRAFVVRIKKLCILGYPKYAQWRFWSDCAHSQADLNVRSAPTSKGTFPDVSAHFCQIYPDTFILYHTCYTIVISPFEILDFMSELYWLSVQCRTWSILWRPILINTVC